jgi:hypothetical protein
LTPDLLPGEMLLLATRRHLIILLVPLLLVLVSAILMETYACPIALDLQLDGRCPIVVAGFGGSAAFIVVLDWLTTRFLLTDQRLLFVQAPIWWRVRSLRPADMAGVTLRVGILGRLLGFGDVIVDSSATRGSRLVLDLIPDPEGVQARIAEAIAAAARVSGR